MRRQHVGCPESAGPGPKQIERPDDATACPDRYSVDRREAGGQGDRFEPSPTTTAGQVWFHDRFPASPALQARTFARLKLEQLRGTHPAAGRAPHPELPVGGGQEDPGRRSVKQLTQRPASN